MTSRPVTARRTRSRSLRPATALASTALLATAIFASHGSFARSSPVALPGAKVGTSLAAGKPQVAVFAGGCFWGIEAVFEHVEGVQDAVSGYAGGKAGDARYSLVSSGGTAHAESVKVTYDPSKVSYGQLLEVFFSVAHDPTQLNRQARDVGPQYRSEIFTTSAAQKQAANAYIAQLTAAKSFKAHIVTLVEPLQAFYPAEKYHQDYARLNPRDPYIVYNDAPKVVHLKNMFPALYTGS